MKITHNAPKLSTGYAQVMHRVTHNLLERFFHHIAPRSGGFFGARGKWASPFPSWLLLLLFVFSLMLLSSVVKTAASREPTSTPNDDLSDKDTEQEIQPGTGNE